MTKSKRGSGKHAPLIALIGNLTGMVSIKILSSTPLQLSLGEKESQARKNFSGFWFFNR